MNGGMKEEENKREPWQILLQGSVCIVIIMMIEKKEFDVKWRVEILGRYYE